MCLLIIYDSGYLMVFLYHTGKLKAFLKAEPHCLHGLTLYGVISATNCQRVKLHFNSACGLERK